MPQLRKNWADNLMNLKSLLKLAAAIALSQAAGAIGTLFTFSAIREWYIYLEKPFFSPPNWLFGPVWTTLYTLMGIALYLLWQYSPKTKAEKTTLKKVLSYFYIQLFLNASWSIVFFGYQNIGGGVINILLLWGFILAVMISGYKLSRWVTLLFLPYLLWVSFASVVNYSLWLLN